MLTGRIDQRQLRTLQLLASRLLGRLTMREDPPPGGGGNTRQRNDTERHPNPLPPHPHRTRTRLARRNRGPRLGDGTTFTRLVSNLV
ncbi:hypothetical protein [Nocardia stercoris]|uniref:Uncharacterized protein n=1 Tax=Nocardia stercoris TaxID=2483361 RepID=A0A3M2L2J2_9NOCA|nr:hypothetical protein [Nocardia stercoris]RMI30035.1 hypothetical protein EBN03_22590 [Nocardia stercoris]